MVVEFLTFAVDDGALDEWLEVEERVWSRYLETVPGFIRKEVWQSGPGVVHAVIWWESREHWKAVTPDQVAEVDERMGSWHREPVAREYRVLRTR